MNAPSAQGPGDNVELPLVSVIVPTFNRASFLERCVRSILNQTYPRLECLVMDGASRDGSVAVLQRLAAEDQRLRFVSEPDAGEVDASNKGVALARGEIVGIQASDDYYDMHAVESAVSYLRAHPQMVGVSGDALFVDPEGRPLGRGMITYRGRMTRETLRRILVLRYRMSFLNHGAFFGWRDRLMRHGGLNPAFSVTPDVDFYTRVLAAGDEIGCLPQVLVHYTIHPDMGAIKHWSRVEEQLRQIHDRCGLRWYHHLLRITAGRVHSYWTNPYRTPLLTGLRREARDWWLRRTQGRRVG